MVASEHGHDLMVALDILGDALNASPIDPVALEAAHERFHEEFLAQLRYEQEHDGKVRESGEQE